ncbi:MAG: 2-hydroxyacid dehydrogenase [Thermoplasmata archaeon]
MKLFVPFKLDEKYMKIGREIIGDDNIIWFPETGDADILLIRGNDFPKDRKFKFIQTVSAGTDHINLKNIDDSTIIASNAGAYSISVAEHAIALMLSRSKYISTFENETRAGIYKPRPTRLLHGKTLGIIGYGGIGSRTAEIAKSFGMRVISIARGHRDTYSDEYLSMEDLDILLKQADYVLISIPLTTRTLGLIGKRELKLLKKDCTIINVARPEIVKKEEMLEFLDENNEASYLTDVWWGEPELDGSRRENVVITPHIAGGLSGEIMEFSYRSAFENIKRYMDGKEPRNIVKRDEGIFIEREKIGI